MKIKTGKGTIPLITLIAIWSISALTSLPGLAVSPILGDLTKIFPKATDLDIQMLTSLPSLLIIPFILLGGKLTEKVDFVRVLQVGLWLFATSGVLYLLSNKMWQLIVVSALLGFLIDPHVLDKIIEAAEVTKDDFVLEIGPGIGTMTQYLCEAARQVLAVEIDNNLIPILQETLSPYDNVEILHGDILKQDIHEIAEKYNDKKPIKVVANLPYYITTPIIMGLLESHVPLANITVMVQKEVAERMQAEPGTKEYGALSLAVQYYAKPYLAANVPPNCFMPRPNVGSAVIRLDCLNRVPIEVSDEKLMFRLIRASFNQRRKTLQNGLANSPELSFSKEEIKSALEEMELSPTIRGEKLSLAQFAALADELKKIQQGGNTDE